MRYVKLNDRARTPVYSSKAAAGADLYTCSAEPLTIQPGETVLVHTGIAVELPDGYVGLIFARSGLATKKGLAPANKVGVIDADYRGELMVSLHNHSAEAQTIAPFERIAQLAVVPFIQVSYEEAESLAETERGTGGFGSTGKF